MLSHLCASHAPLMAAINSFKKKYQNIKSSVYYFLIYRRPVRRKAQLRLLRTLTQLAVRGRKKAQLSRFLRPSRAFLRPRF